MSEYPEDIMKAAQKAIDHMPDLKAMMDPSQFWEVAEEAVAAAILAERERCRQFVLQAHGLDFYPTIFEDTAEAISKGGAA